MLQVLATRCRLVCCTRCLSCTASWLFWRSERRPGVAPRAAFFHFQGPYAALFPEGVHDKHMHRKLQEVEPTYSCFVRSL